MPLKQADSSYPEKKVEDEKQVLETDSPTCFFLLSIFTHLSGLANAWRKKKKKGKFEKLVTMPLFPKGSTAPGLLQRTKELTGFCWGNAVSKPFKWLQGCQTVLTYIKSSHIHPSDLHSTRPHRVWKRGRWYQHVAFLYSHHPPSVSSFCCHFWRLIFLKINTCGRGTRPTTAWAQHLLWPSQNSGWVLL